LVQLQALCDFDDYFCYHEDNHPFVECATFADDYKYSAAAWQSEQHYVDTPIIWEGESSDYEIPQNIYNITETTAAIIQWLSKADDGQEYLESYVY
jgi:hypothetical protein